MRNSLTKVVCLLVVGMILANATTRADLPVEEAKLLPPDGAEDDWFGWAVAVDGDTAVITSHNDDDNGLNSGSAYVFVHSAGMWFQQAKLLASDGESGDRFGDSAAVAGDTAVIGMRYDDDNGFNAGAAYVFTRDAGIWSQQAKLLASDGIAEDYFGYSVAVDGDTALIGSYTAGPSNNHSGSAYVFKRADGVWSEQAKLRASDPSFGALFGITVALDGDTALIGASHDDDNGYQAGSAYVFVRVSGVWTEQAKLLPNEGDSLDYFGGAVAVDGDTAVIGVPGDDDLGSGTGSAYVYHRIINTWVERGKLLASDGTEDDGFGSSVAVRGGRIVIGAPGRDDNGDGAGAAYLFVLANGQWVEQGKLLAGDGSAGDQFGRPGAMKGGTLLLAAHHDDDNGTNSGSAYVFRMYDDDVPATTYRGMIVMALLLLAASTAFLLRRRGAR
jgi:hypothetical protein